MRLIASVACVYCGAEFHIDNPSITAFDEMSLRLAEHVAKAHPARSDEARVITNPEAL